MQKLISILIFIAGFLIIYLFTPKFNWNEENLSSLSSPEIILSNAINQDLLNLKKNGDLPLEWDSIKTVNVTSESSLRASDLKAQLEVETRLNGKFSLECIILNENPKSKDGRYLVKFSIYDIKNKNQTWEQFRLYKKP